MKMTCSNCDNTEVLEPKKTSIHFKECGLDNVTLKGILEYKCEKCGESYRQYGDLNKIHMIIAQILIQKQQPLTPNEIRFLRKYLGASGAWFARKIGLQPETVCRYETGKAKIPKQYEVNLKSLVANKLPDLAYDLHDQILATKSFNRIELQLKNDDWEYELAAGG